MKTGNISDLGSWKCGKDKAFTHIPTNFMILIKINSIKNHLIKKRRRNIALKKFNINRYWKFYLKNVPYYLMSGSVKNCMKKDDK